MGQVIVLRRDELLGFRALFRQVLVVVWLPSMVPMFLISVAASGQSHGHVPIPTSGELLAMAVFPLFWLLLAVFSASRWAKARDAASIFFVGFFSGATMIGVFAVGSNITRLHRVGVEVLGVAAWSGFLHGIGAVVFWALYRGACLTRGVVVKIQDGHTCAGCGYDLQGNESMVCPECGRRFTVEELGLSAEAFEGLRRDD